VAVKRLIGTKFYFGYGSRIINLAKCNTCADLLDGTESEAEINTENISEQQRFLKEPDPMDTWEARQNDPQDPPTSAPIAQISDPSGTQKMDTDSSINNIKDTGTAGDIPRPKTPFGKNEISSRPAVTSRNTEPTKLPEDLGTSQKETTMAATSSTMTVPTVEEGATEVADVAETATMGVAGG